MSIIDLVREQLGPNAVQEMSQQLGADPATIEKAIQAAVPMMVGGMATTAQHPAGEGALQAAMSAIGGTGGSGGALGGLSGMFGGGGMGGVLGSILGQHHATVQDGVQQASGLDAAKVGQLLMLLAPFIMSALAKHQASPGAQQGGSLAGGLWQEAQNAMAGAGSPNVGGILGKILGAARR